MIRHLTQPEYMHVLLNPLPIYGLAVAVIALVIAMISRARAARVTALAIVFLSAISVWPVYYYGDAGYDRVQALADDDGVKWLDEHQHRAHQLVYFFYSLAALSTVAALSEFRLPRAAAILGPLTLLLALVTLGVSAYIAYPAGRVRHREFRFEPAPEKPKEIEAEETKE